MLVLAVVQKHDPPRRAGGGIGRHVRLRGVWRKPCRFKSCPAHQFLSGSRAIPVVVSRKKSLHEQDCLCYGMAIMAGGPMRVRFLFRPVIVAATLMFFD